MPFSYADYARDRGVRFFLVSFTDLIGDAHCAKLGLPPYPTPAATVAAINGRLAECRTLVWNGPLGAFETPPFDAATIALARIAAAQGQRLIPEPSPEAGWYFRSDHFPFAQRGVPAIAFRAGRNLYTGDHRLAPWYRDICFADEGARKSGVLRKQDACSQRACKCRERQRTAF